MRKKTTFYLDPKLHQAVKALAESTGRHDYEILEEALRQYLNVSESTNRGALRDLLGQLEGQTDLNEDAALDLAYAELHAARRARIPE